MRPFHPIGLPGLRILPAGSPYPLVLPASLSRRHQEVAIALYQAAVAPEVLGRVEVEWRGRLVRASKRYLAHLRDRDAADRSVVVVWLRTAPRDLGDVLTEELLAPFAHLILVSTEPGEWEEPLGPLHAMCAAVYQRLEELYDDLTKPLGLPAADLGELDGRWRLFSSPLDLVELVNHFIEIQLEGFDPVLAGRKATARRVLGRLESFSPDETEALLHAAGRRPGGPPARESLLRLERMGLVVAGGGQVAQGAWPELLYDDDLWQEVDALGSISFEAAWPSPEPDVPEEVAELMDVARLVREGQLDAAEDVLRGYAADPVTLEPPPTMEAELRVVYLEALSRLQAARGELDDSFEAERRAIEVAEGLGWDDRVLARRWERLARRLKRHRRLDHAIEAASRALDLGALEPFGTYLLLGILHDAGCHEEVVEALTSRPVMGPLEKQLLRRALIALGRLEEALPVLVSQAVQERLEGEPRWKRATTLHDLENVLSKLGQAEEAKLAAEAAKELKEDREPPERWIRHVEDLGATLDDAE